MWPAVSIATLPGSTPEIVARHGLPLSRKQCVGPDRALVRINSRKKVRISNCYDVEGAKVQEARAASTFFMPAKKHFAERFCVRSERRTIPAGPRSSRVQAIIPTVFFFFFRIALEAQSGPQCRRRRLADFGIRPSSKGIFPPVSSDGAKPECSGPRSSRSPLSDRVAMVLSLAAAIDAIGTCSS